MRDFTVAVRMEALKLRRTLALWTCFLAPVVVVAFQVAIWLRMKKGFGADVQPWLAFLGNVLAMWALFMQPLTAALVVALVHQTEHANQGWTRLGLLPVPRWVTPAAKAAVSIGLLLLACGVLLAGCLGGVVLADALHPVITVDAPPPLSAMLGRVGSVFSASLLVVAIQCVVSRRFSSVIAPLGTGVAGTFLGLFAAGWKLGPYYPWLMPLHAFHGPDEVALRSLLLGSLGGLAVLAAHVLVEGQGARGRR